jgi:hypothetical protein
MGKGSSNRDSTAASADDLRKEQVIREELGQLEVPLLQRQGDAHQYLFFAFLDGTGQDLNNPKLGPETNVGLLFKQALARSNEPDSRIDAHYSRGIGTQPRVMGRALDGMFAHSWDDGIKEAYVALARKAGGWMRSDPDAEIRVVGTGYSRGAVQTAGLLRLIDQYGIANPSDLEFGQDNTGNISVISASPPLVAPGNVAQAALLFDPVATNMPRNFDARLPPSVISRVSIMAAHERRELFPHQTINEPGMTPDGRAINVAAPGGHSNVGGGNRDAGLEILTGNAAIDYLNTLRDEPLFKKREVPDDLAAMTRYQAGGATSLYGLRMDDDDQRNLREALANCKVVDPCKGSEPIDQALAAQFEHRTIPVDSVEREQLQALVQRALERDLAPPATQNSPAPARSGPDAPEHPDHPALQRIRDGARAAEDAGQISFADDQQREQFCRSALACMKDNRETWQTLYPGRGSDALQHGEISRVDDLVIGSKGYAFLVQHGSGPQGLQRVPFDVELAKQTPVAASDQKLEAANREIDQAQAFPVHAVAQVVETQSMGAFAR